MVSADGGCDIFWDRSDNVGAFEKLLKLQAVVGGYLKKCATIKIQAVEAANLLLC